MKTDTSVQETVKLASETENRINKLINVFFTSAYRCKSMTYYFENPSVALSGVADLHRWSAVSEVMFARGLIEYLKLRGGRVELYDIESPLSPDDNVLIKYLGVDDDGTCKFEPIESSSQSKQDENELVIDAIQCLLRGKRAVYDYVLKVHKSAFSGDNYDPHLLDFLEVNYIRPIANVNRKLGILQSQAILACRDEKDSVGLYQFNKDVKKNMFKIMTVNKLVRPDKWSVTY